MPPSRPATAADRPHTLVCDLALLDALTPEGAVELATATTLAAPRVLLLEPTEPVSATLREAVPEVLAHPATVVTDATEALAPHCLPL